MNNNLVFAIALASLIVASLCDAQDMSSELSTCMGSTQGGQMGVRRCLDEERSRLETKMNSIIEKKLSDQKSHEAEMMEIGEGAFYPDLAVLSHAQKAWFQFRDAECKWRVELYSSGTYGTMNATKFLSCQIEMTRARILIL